MSYHDDYDYVSPRYAGRPHVVGNQKTGMVEVSGIDNNVHVTVNVTVNLTVAPGVESKDATDLGELLGNQIATALRAAPKDTERQQPEPQPSALWAEVVDEPPKPSKFSWPLLTRGEQ